MIFERTACGNPPRHIAPVFVSAAAPNAGVRELMDEIIALMPNAAEMPGTEALDASGNSVTLKIDTAASFHAHVLKTIADPFVGNCPL